MDFDDVLISIGAYGSFTEWPYQNQAVRQIVNEALYLRGLNEQATLSIPIGTPENWPERAWLGSHTKVGHTALIR